MCRLLTTRRQLSAGSSQQECAEPSRAKQPPDPTSSLNSLRSSGRLAVVRVCYYRLTMRYCTMLRMLCFCPYNMYIVLFAGWPFNNYESPEYLDGTLREHTLCSLMFCGLLQLPRALLVFRATLVRPAESVFVHPQLATVALILSLWVPRGDRLQVRVHLHCWCYYAHWVDEEKSLICCRADGATDSQSRLGWLVRT